MSSNDRQGLRQRDEIPGWDLIALHLGDRGVQPSRTSSGPTSTPPGGYHVGRRGSIFYYADDDAAWDSRAVGA